MLVRELDEWTDVYDVIVDRKQLEHDSEFKYLGFVLDGQGTESVEYCRKAMNAKEFDFRGQGYCMRVWLCGGESKLY